MRGTSCHDEHIRQILCVAAAAGSKKNVSTQWFDEMFPRRAARLKQALFWLRLPRWIENLFLPDKSDKEPQAVC